MCCVTFNYACTHTHTFKQIHFIQTDIWLKKRIIMHRKKATWAHKEISNKSSCCLAFSSLHLIWILWDSFSLSLSSSSFPGVQAVRLSYWTLMRDSMYYTVSVATLIVVSRASKWFLMLHWSSGLFSHSRRREVSSSPRGSINSTARLLFTHLAR